MDRGFPSGSGMDRGSGGSIKPPTNQNTSGSVMGRGFPSVSGNGSRILRQHRGMDWEKWFGESGSGELMRSPGVPLVHVCPSFLQTSSRLRQADLVYRRPLRPKRLFLDVPEVFQTCYCIRAKGGDIDSHVVRIIHPPAPPPRFLPVRCGYMATAWCLTESPGTTDRAAGAGCSQVVV
eukprot:gene25494-biopygen1453